MKARKSRLPRAKSAVLIGAMCAVLSFNVLADSSAKLDPRDPLPATLLPEMKVTASLSNPDLAPSWSLASTRPQPVTLMPTLTITADAEALADVVTLPTVVVVADVESASDDATVAFAVASMPANVSFQLAK